MKGFYVTVKRDTRTGWLVGPFADHETALALVEPVKRRACEIDARCSFDAFGTSSITRDDCDDIEKFTQGNLMLDPAIQSAIHDCTSNKPMEWI